MYKVLVFTLLLVVLLLSSSNSHAIDTDVNYKEKYNTGIAENPSYCIGYADTKMWQSMDSQYYVWMKEWYEEQTSSTDLSTLPFDNRSYILGTEFADNDLTVDCVLQFDYIMNMEDTEGTEND